MRSPWLKFHVDGRAEIEFVEIDALDEANRGVGGSDARAEAQLRHQRVKFRVDLLRCGARETIFE